MSAHELNRIEDVLCPGFNKQKYKEKSFPFKLLDPLMKSRNFHTNQETIWFFLMIVI